MSLALICSKLVVSLNSERFWLSAVCSSCMAEIFSCCRALMWVCFSVVAASSAAFSIDVMLAVAVSNVVFMVTVADCIVLW